VCYAVALSSSRLISFSLGELLHYTQGLRMLVICLDHAQFENHAPSHSLRHANGIGSRCEKARLPHCSPCSRLCVPCGAPQRGRRVFVALLWQFASAIIHKIHEPACRRSEALPRKDHGHASSNPAMQRIATRRLNSLSMTTHSTRISASPPVAIR
jgi:hypothetical protein